MMKLVRWSPSRNLFGLRDDVDQVLHACMRDFVPAESKPQSWSPASDVRETEEGFEIRVDLPGMKQKDVKVSVFGDTVTVRGERKSEKEEKEEKNGGWHRVERYHGVFERSFNLGSELEAKQVKARYQDGVLELSVPKAEAAKPREIEIEVGS